MSSIVSRRPPFSVSTSQSNDFFWISMRFGTSRTLSSRANERRVRGASMEAKTATPLGLASGQRAVAPPGLPHRGEGGGRRSRTPSGPASVCGGGGNCGRLRLSADLQQCIGEGKGWVERRLERRRAPPTRRPSNHGFAFGGGTALL